MAAFNLYDKFRLRQASGQGAADLSTASIKAMLVSSAYTPDQAAHEFRSSLSGEMANGGGYATGGIAVGADTIALNAGTGLVTVDFDDSTLVWSANGSGFSTARRVIFYVVIGSSATDILIGYSDDFGANLGNTAADLQIQLNANGLFTAPR